MYQYPPWPPSCWHSISRPSCSLMPIQNYLAKSDFEVSAEQIPYRMAPELLQWRGFARRDKTFLETSTIGE